MCETSGLKRMFKTNTRTKWLICWLVDYGLSKRRRSIVVFVVIVMTGGAGRR